MGGRSGLTVVLVQPAAEAVVEVFSKVRWQWLGGDQLVASLAFGVAGRSQEEGGFLSVVVEAFGKVKLVGNE